MTTLSSGLAMAIQGPGARPPGEQRVLHRRVLPATVAPGGEDPLIGEPGGDLLPRRPVVGVVDHVGAGDGAGLEEPDVGPGPDEPDGPQGAERLGLRLLRGDGRPGAQ